MIRSEVFLFQFKGFNANEVGIQIQLSLVVSDTLSGLESEQTQHNLKLSRPEERARNKAAGTTTRGDQPTKILWLTTGLLMNAILS